MNKKPRNIPQKKLRSASYSPDKIKIANNIGKLKVNRCCLVHPKQKDFGQITENSQRDEFTFTDLHRYSTLLVKQYGFDPTVKNIIQNQMRNKLRGNVEKVDNGLQYDGETVSKFVETSDGTLWQNIDNIDDIEKFIQDANKGVNPRNDCNTLSKNVRISNVPRVKVIAVKFSKYKQNNLELRRLEEKVVCVEYDVYSKDNVRQPVQIMRAFFCIKPVQDQASESLTELPTIIKQQLNVLDNMDKFSKKEIEIIDENISENKCYLNDLRRILKRNQITYEKNNRESLNLNNLYEIAKRGSYIVFSDLSSANLLSKSELADLKDLILMKCKSSIHGISRRKMSTDHDTKPDVGVLSGSIVAELLRENSKM